MTTEDQSYFRVNSWKIQFFWVWSSDLDPILIANSPVKWPIRILFIFRLLKRDIKLVTYSVAHSMAHFANPIAIFDLFLAAFRCDVWKFSYEIFDQNESFFSKNHRIELIIKTIRHVFFTWNDNLMTHIIWTFSMKVNFLISAA